MRRPALTFRPDAGDPLEDRFRLDTVPAGSWVTFLLCGGALAYVLLFAGSAHRGLLAALVGIGLAAGVVVLFLPWEAIVRSRWREAAFLTWTLLDFALITIVAAVDGGAASPLALLFFIPVVFSSLSYPLPSVTLVGVLGVATYVVLAFASSTDPGYALMFSVALTGTALMSVWQARNHDRWRGELSLVSRTDPLTGALNRRGFEEAASSALSRLAREDAPMCLLLVDLDDFKSYNDQYGHAAGDELLRLVVRTTRKLLRPGDAVARMGGDEFAVLLPGTGDEEGRSVVSRLAERLGVEIPHSTGLACAPCDGRELDVLYRAADAELYAAKRSRRRVAVRS